MTTTSKPNILIRKATLGDVESISRLARGVFTATFGYSVPSDDLYTYLDEFFTIEAFSEYVENPVKDVFVAVTTDDEIIGLAVLVQGGTEPCLEGFYALAELQRLYVDSRFQGRGIARLLTQKIDDTARAKGFQHIWLGVWEDNHRAQRLYEKEGYKPIGDHKFVMGSTVQRDLVMIKRF